MPINMSSNTWDRKLNYTKELNDPALKTKLREAIVENGGGHGSEARAPENYTKERAEGVTPRASATPQNVKTWNAPTSDSISFHWLFGRDNVPLGETMCYPR